MQQTSHNPSQNALLTDLYQMTMAYAHWRAGSQDNRVTFDLYFRKAPFGGSYALFGGLDECIQFLLSFQITPSQAAYVGEQIKGCDPLFLKWLQQVDCSTVEIYAQQPGSVVFPNVPMMRVSGPLAIVHLLETPFLNLVGFASLVMTNANRFCLAAGPSATLLEFGVRRAQGPDGALTASKYCYAGGFKATSNVAAGHAFGIPVRGTHSHAYILHFAGLDDVPENLTFKASCGRVITSSWLRDRALEIRKSIHDKFTSDKFSSDGELAAFVTYASVYPDTFNALIDTYSSLESGAPNFMSVALALMEVGHTALGVRLDSGDLLTLARKVRKFYKAAAIQYVNCFNRSEEDILQHVNRFGIIASDNLTVERVADMRAKGTDIDIYGVGTALVTCKEDPALGCVFKLCSVENSGRMKFSEDPIKSSMPGIKAIFRVFTGDVDYGMCDVITMTTEDIPTEGKSFEGRDAKSHALITIHVKEVIPLLKCVWNGATTDHAGVGLNSLQRIRERVKEELSIVPDVCKRFDGNAQSIKLLLSTKLFGSFESLSRWYRNRFVE